MTKPTNQRHNLHKTAILTVTLSVLLTTSPQTFAFNKCVQSDGKVIFTDSACAAGSKAERINTKSSANTGTIPQQWRNGYCKVKFTRDSVINDIFFSGVKLDIRKGDEFILSDIGLFDIDILYFSRQGALELSFEKNKNGDNPFDITPDCAETNKFKQSSVSAVLVDTTLFADENLQKKICQLTAGTLINTRNSLSIRKSENASGNRYVELITDGLSEKCNGQRMGYYALAPENISGLTYERPPRPNPIVNILSPRKAE